MNHHQVMLKLIESAQRKYGTGVNKELFEFLEGETIHTENCYKFTKESFTAMSSKAGLYPVKTWTDDQNLFAVMLLRTTSNL